MSDSSETVPPPARPPRPMWLLVVMILLTLVLVVVFAFSCMMAMTSPMVFDSGQTPALWRAFGIMLFFPIFVLLSAGLSWLGYFLRSYIMIALGAVAPFAYLAIFFLLYS